MDVRASGAERDATIERLRGAAAGAGDVRIQRKRLWQKLLKRG